MLLKFSISVLAAAAFIAVQPLVDDDVLEPSVENEVVHALDAAPANPPQCAIPREEAVSALVGTNRLTATERAIRLVSSQPRARFMFCIAAPEAPVPRLSNLATRMTRSSLP